MKCLESGCERAPIEGKFRCHVHMSTKEAINEGILDGPLHDPRIHVNKECEVIDGKLLRPGEVGEIDDTEFMENMAKSIELLDAFDGMQEDMAGAMEVLDDIMSKKTNPKDAVGMTKAPLHLIPSSAKVEMAMAFMEGALKYGKYNWRAAGVRASIYADAMERHLCKWLNGEDTDPQTGVLHLASVMACCAILIDAKVCGKLNDDRPPTAPVSKQIDGKVSHVAYLKDKFKDFTPHQHTIEDEF